MKVLHVLDVSWPVQRGYSIRGYYITKFQYQDGLVPIVLTSPRQYNDNRGATHEGISYYRTESGKGVFSNVIILRELSQIIRLTKRIREVAIRENVDWIHAHSPVLWGIAAFLAGSSLKKKVIYEIRAFWEDAAVDAGKYRQNSMKYRISQALETLLVKRVDKVVAICEGIKKDLIRRKVPEDKIVVVPNGVDTQNFKMVSKSGRLVQQYGLEGKVVCGFIGSMFNFEGLELLVEVASLLQARCHNLHVLLIGEGERYQDIKNRVAAAGLEDMVTVAGKVPHHQIGEYYSVIDIFVYPRISKRITELVTPLKPLEAMAMAKTVIASDVGGLKELILDGENGYLFKAGHADALAKKIEELVRSPEKILATGVRARQLIEQQRNWEQLIKQYQLQVYA